MKDINKQKGCTVPLSLENQTLEFQHHSGCWLYSECNLKDAMYNLQCNCFIAWLQYPCDRFEALNWNYYFQGMIQTKSKSKNYSLVKIEGEILYQYGSKQCHVINRSYVKSLQKLANLEQLPFQQCSSWAYEEYKTKWRPNLTSGTNLTLEKTNGAYPVHFGRKQKENAWKKNCTRQQTLEWTKRSVTTALRDYRRSNSDACKLQGLVVSISAVDL